MPSFEETNKGDADNPDFQYQPGMNPEKNTRSPIPETDAATENAPDGSSTETVQPKARTAIPDELKPAVLDASIPLPKPAPLQKTRQNKADEVGQVKKRNLRSRSGTDSTSGSGKQAQSFGEIENIQDAKESLSGRQSQSSSSNTRRRSARSTRDGAQASYSREDRHTSQRSQKSRTEDKGSLSSRGAQYDRNSKGTRQSNEEQGKRRRNRRSEPPQGLIAKISQFLKSFFSPGEAAQPKREERPRQSARKRPRKRSSVNKPRNAQLNSDESTTPAKKKPRRRRRSRNRNGNGKDSPGSDEKS